MDHSIFNIVEKILIAYLISLEFLYRLFEQLSILYSDCAERQVPLEYLHTQMSQYKYKRWYYYYRIYPF